MGEVNQNFSTDGEALRLKPNKTYIAIESLYLNDIKREIDKLKMENLLEEIKEKVFPFPYTDVPFATFLTKDESFPISSIRKKDYDSITEREKEQCFTTDSGLIIILRPTIIKEFVQNYSYDELVDSLVELINLDYWDRITDGFDKGDIGLIVAPGIDSGFEFEGSGIYEIVL